MVIIAFTDTDLKEGAALLEVFPHIWSLICKLYLRQAWCYNRNKVLKGKSPTITEPKARMGRVETELIQTANYFYILLLSQSEKRSVEY